MHRYYFPICPVDGPIEPPVPFEHMGTSGAVPQKCSQCDKLFEGECIRYIESVGHYLNLDHCPCGIDGSTDPVTYDDLYITSKVQVPRKYARCGYLRIDNIRGFCCTKESGKWGNIPRGLDWGAWEPDVVYLELPLPKVTTRQLSKHAFADDLLSFIKEHRRTNPGLSIAEAKADFQRFRSIIEGDMR